MKMVMVHNSGNAGAGDDYSGIGLRTVLERECRISNSEPRLDFEIITPVRFSSHTST